MGVGAGAARDLRGRRPEHDFNPKHRVHRHPVRSAPQPPPARLGYFFGSVSSLRGGSFDLLDLSPTISCSGRVKGRRAVSRIRLQGKSKTAMHRARSPNSSRACAGVKSSTFARVPEYTHVSCVTVSVVTVEQAGPQRRMMPSVSVRRKPEKDATLRTDRIFWRTTAKRRFKP